MAKNDMPNNVEDAYDENYQPKTLCVLTVDVSGSMTGKPIAELNQGLQEFYTDIKQNKTTADRLEVAIVAFSSGVDIIQQPALADHFSMPTLKVGGSTKLVDGVRKAIKMADQRKTYYKNTGVPYYRPWIILITDGMPDNDQDVDGLAQEIRTGVDEKHFFFFAIGVEGADMNMLKKISSPQMEPAKLAGLQFTKFFKWLSNSMGVYAGAERGDQVEFPTPDWIQGVTIS